MNDSEFNEFRQVLEASLPAGRCHSEMMTHQKLHVPGTRCMTTQVFDNSVDCLRFRIL